MAKELAKFAAFGTKTIFTTTVGNDRKHVVDTFVNEFWTAGQRAGHGLHEVSYRACFKPQLPEFFIRRLTRPGDVVYDPFAGRGTTPIEAALLGRAPYANDISPLSVLLLRPRLSPPTQREVDERLAAMPLEHRGPLPEELLVFYHEATLREICALRDYLLAREADGRRDGLDDWIRMVAVNRLTGHSPGFFSVYSLPPNQAVSVQSQKKINEKRQQTPPRRDVKQIIAKKSRSLLADVTDTQRTTMRELAPRAVLCTAPAAATPAIGDGSVQLVVTSPPFLDVVQYATDNWLRCWFCGIDGDAVPITMAKTVERWQAAMQQVFVELHRVVRSGGHVAFEVGEVKGGSVRLEQAVIPAAAAAGFVPELVLINEQEFTKTANCWGIDNNQKGTNSNRIVLLRRP
ncbi:MAG: site-specific DNA-methyltransferase [Planctomycetes bacterium]|nr:site-specific DNA-methyltransferase [Planctomycetota bacterium]